MGPPGLRDRLGPVSGSITKNGGKILAFIEARGLRYRYEAEEGSHEVLHGVDLDIEAGEFVALLGHNGCGKSTMAKLLNGMRLLLWITSIIRARRQ